MKWIITYDKPIMTMEVMYSGITEACVIRPLTDRTFELETQDTKTPKVEGAEVTRGD